MAETVAGHYEDARRSRYDARPHRRRHRRGRGRGGGAAAPFYLDYLRDHGVHAPRSQRRRERARPLVPGARRDRPRAAPWRRRPTRRRTCARRSRRSSGRARPRRPGRPARLRHRRDAARARPPRRVVFPARPRRSRACSGSPTSARVPVVPRGVGHEPRAPGPCRTAAGSCSSLTRMNRLRRSAPATWSRCASRACARSSSPQAAAAARACSTRPTRAATRPRRSAATSPSARGGLRGLKYGVTRDYVLGVEAVLAHGRGDPQRRPARQGRRRLRPHAACCAAARARSR